MIALHYPIAILSILLAAYLFRQGWHPKPARVAIAITFCLLALHQLASIGINQTGWNWLPYLRVFLASMMLVSFFLHFVIFHSEKERPLRQADTLFVAAPVVLLFVVFGYGLGLWVDIYLGLLTLVLALRLLFLLVQSPRKSVWLSVGVCTFFVIALIDLSTTLELGTNPLTRSSKALLFGSCLILSGLSWLTYQGFAKHGPFGWLKRKKPFIPSETLRRKLQSAMTTDQLWIDPELTLPRLARRLGVSQKQLSEHINMIEAGGFRRWLNRYRIDAAKRKLIERPETAIIDLMLEVGFQSRSAFYNAFKTETGASPGDWRSHH